MANLTRSYSHIYIIIGKSFQIKVNGSNKYGTINKVITETAIIIVNKNPGEKESRKGKNNFQVIGIYHLETFSKYEQTLIPGNRSCLKMSFK